VPSSIDFSNPMTTAGDLIIGGTSGAPGRLAAGASGYVLTSNGSGAAPSWQAGGGGGGGFGNGEASFTAPVLGSFTQDNFGGSTSATTVTLGGISAIQFTDPGLSGNTNCLRSLLQAIPTPANPWTVTARIRTNSLIVHFVQFGLVLKDSTSGKYISYGWCGDTGPLGLVEWTNANSFSGDSVVNAVGTPPFSMDMTDAWFQWQYDGTHLNYNYSRDGNYFVTLQQTSPTALLPNLPDYAGIGMNVNSAGSILQTCNMECFSFTLTQP